MEYDRSTCVWVSKWALTHGIFEVQAEPNEGWINFINPWNGKNVGAGPGDWHRDRWGALRQAISKKRHEMNYLVSRLGSLNRHKFQEYEWRDIKNNKHLSRSPDTEMFEVKRGIFRKGMERHWGDAERPAKAPDEDRED